MCSNHLLMRFNLIILIKRVIITVVSIHYHNATCGAIIENLSYTHTCISISGLAISKDCAMARHNFL